MYLLKFKTLWVHCPRVGQKAKHDADANMLLEIVTGRSHKYLSFHLYLNCAKTPKNDRILYVRFIVIWYEHIEIILYYQICHLILNTIHSNNGYTCKYSHKKG